MSNFNRNTLLVSKNEEKRPRLCEQQMNRKNIPLGGLEAERSFSHTHNWHHNSILTDLSGDVAVIALHGYRTLILKTDLFNAYMSISLH